VLDACAVQRRRELHFGVHDPVAGPADPCSYALSGTTTIAIWFRRYGILLGAILLGIVIRLTLAPLGWHKYDMFTYGDWAWQLLEEPRSRFYAAPLEVPGDHLPGDLTIMWGLAHLTHWLAPDLDFFSVTYKVILKLVPIVADLILPLGILAIGRRYATQGRTVMVASVMALSPATIVISAVWGQWDSVSMVAVVAAVILLMYRRTGWGLPFLAYACLLKPQLGILIPIFAITDVRMWVHGAGPRALWQVLVNWIAGGLASIVLVVALCLPFDVGLPGMGQRWSLLDRIADAANRYDGTSMSAFNLWYLITPHVRVDTDVFLLGTSYHLVGIMALALGVGVGLLGAILIRPVEVGALWGMTAAMTAVFMLATRSHERYLFPAVVLSMLLLTITDRYRWVAIWLTVATFVNVYLTYALYHDHVNPVPLQAVGVHRSLAGINVVLYLWMAFDGLRDVLAVPGLVRTPGTGVTNTSAIDGERAS
jgi:dolichyl-phosphate-mannose-protein mannosyltransferase